MSEPTIHDLLVMLAEEACEIAQAASKIYRFGAGFTPHNKGVTALQNLSAEVGDLEGVLDMLAQKGLHLDLAVRREARREKPNKIRRWHGVKNWEPDEVLKARQDEQAG